jgi:DNA-binding response OmpR family regulator
MLCAASFCHFFTFSYIVTSSMVSAGHKKLGIALVEDDEILSKVMREELEDAGFSVRQAFDGEAGLSLVREMRPDLVLLDVVMPKKRGLDVLETIKSTPDLKDIPVIVLTMLGRDDDIKAGLALGANDYIVKSQHAVAEVAAKVSQFFGAEQHPTARQKKDDPETPPEKTTSGGVA